MRIVIVGGSGNIGTAVLRAALAAGHTVDAVSRRAPAPGGVYDNATWRPLDLTAAGAGAQLADLARGADAVVHAAWALQPTHDRGRLRQVNVEGTRVVLDAVAKAGVPSLVYLSSVGAYAPRASLEPVDEQWPTTGMPTSAYSQDKAAVESLLDEFESDFPAVAVTRLRPGLVLQRDAAAEIQRYFVGPLAPRKLWDLLRRGRLGVLPLPKDLVVQVVHSDDVASAALTAAERLVRGPVNLAAAPVVDHDALARITGNRVVAVPTRPLRSAVTLAWRAHVLPTSPGWYDLATSVPLLRTDRAADVLGWAPIHTATEVVAELLAGLAAGGGVEASPALRP
ncbi:NAD-dependent epimerase/dehydratase family protein [Actinokineospora sp. G85]|uniref:NAD-dependent epimerase/dehydratase family protein n=1 Tax=Actinokineospora sp. G85 TaxID=3406626 RepID=UPI003C77DCA5